MVRGTLAMVFSSSLRVIVVCISLLLLPLLGGDCLVAADNDFLSGEGISAADGLDFVAGEYYLRSGDVMPLHPHGRNSSSNTGSNVMRSRELDGCWDPKVDLDKTTNAPPIGQLGDPAKFTTAVGTFRGARTSHRSKINEKKSFLFGTACQCIDAASYRIEIYEINNNPWEWVHIHMSFKRRCCSIQEGVKVDEACRGIPENYQVTDKFEKGEAYFWDPSEESDRDILSDLGSAASILALVLALIPGPP